MQGRNQGAAPTLYFLDIIDLLQNSGIARKLGLLGMYVWIIPYGMSDDIF